MSCKKKTCKYFKNCLVKRENDGTGCSDYERGEVKMSTKFKQKKRYTDQDVTDALIFAQNKGINYDALSVVYIYRFTSCMSNKECIQIIERVLNNKGYSLFERSE